MKKILILLFLTIFLSVIFSSSSRLVIQSGHNGSVNSLVYHNKFNLLLSAGDDGTIKIWNPETKELSYNIQLTHLPIEKIIINPEKPHFTALIKTSLTSSKLIGYDWINDKKIFTLDLNEVPLFITYSGIGKYLIYLKTEWDSIVACNAITGQKLPILNDGFGIVSFSMTFSDDKKIFAYKPSGKFIFKEIATGNDLLQKPLNTLENLKAISISSNTRFIAASWGKELVIIDLLTGIKLASIEKPNIVSTSIRSDGKEILCLYKNENINQISKFAFNGKELIEVPFTNKITYSVTDCIYLKDTVFFTTTTGEILKLLHNSEISDFSNNNLIKITDIAFSPDKIAFGNSKHIILINPDLLQDPYDKKVTYTTFPNLFSKAIGLNFIDSNKLLIWNKENKPYKFYVLDTNSGEVIAVSEEFSSMLLQIDILKFGILSLEQNGSFMILNQNTFEPLFKYTSSGINKVLYISDNLVIAACNKIGQTGSSLLQINSQTGETVPIVSSSLLCYDIAYNQNKNILYSLNILKDNTSTSSIIKLHYDKGYEKERNLSTFAGEDLSASIVISNDGKYLYSSMGFDTIEVYDGISMKKFAQTKTIPRKLYVYDDHLISINRDFSITIWNRFTGKKNMDIYLLKTDEINWIARFSDVDYSSSKMAIDYIKEY